MTPLWEELESVADRATSLRIFASADRTPATCAGRPASAWNLARSFKYRSMFDKRM